MQLSLPLAFFKRPRMHWTSMLSSSAYCLVASTSPSSRWNSLCGSSLVCPAHQRNTCNRGWGTTCGRPELKRKHFWAINSNFNYRSSLGWTSNPVQALNPLVLKLGQTLLSRLPSSEEGSKTISYLNRSPSQMFIPSFVGLPQSCSTVVGKLANQIPYWPLSTSLRYIFYYNWGKPAKGMDECTPVLSVTTV